MLAKVRAVWCGLGLIMMADRIWRAQEMQRAVVGAAAVVSEWKRIERKMREELRGRARASALEKIRAQPFF